MAFAVVVAVSASLAVRCAEVTTPKSATLSVCDLMFKGDSLIGKTVAITGQAHQDIEVAMLQDPPCPFPVLLESAPGSPSLLECLSESNSPKCGGVTHNGQVATAIGILIAGPKSVKFRGKPTLWTSARLRVLEFKASDKGKGPHGT